MSDPNLTPPAGRSLLLYDRDCGFCKVLAGGVLAWDRQQRLRPSAIQGPEAQTLLSDLPVDERLASWHLVSPDGVRRSGGAAVAPMLRELPGGTPLAVLVDRIPGVTDRAYRWVAEHRSSLSRLIPLTVKRRASDSIASYERTRS